MYRGMGSLDAMKEGKTRDRYNVREDEVESKIVPEGIEGRVPYRGSLSFTLHQLIGGLRSGMGYLGCASLEELQDEGQVPQDHERRPEGKPRARRDDHQGSSELQDRVKGAWP